MSKVTNLAERSDAVATTVAKVDELQSPPVVLHLLFLSVINLLIGTIQGVLQTFPGVAQWIREAGPAGHLIDPLAHAHINLVGGVTMGMMGLFYYVLPKLVHRPMYSPLLAAVSFWFSAIGVFSFFSSLVVLGIIEGNMVHNGMTYAQAREAVGPIHHILIMTAAFLMGFGYWAFISNTLLTIFKKPKGESHASTA
jgi:cbb3-type cytochrome oxidase subunit 1